MEIIRTNISKWLSNSDESSSLPILAISSLLIGFVLGACVYPVWTDNVESAQVLAGLVKYNSPANPMYIYHRSAYSVLIQGAALLLRLGISEWIASVLFSGLQSAIGFSALALCTFAISRNIFSSLLTPFIVLRIALSPSTTSSIYLAALHGHNYPILFPTSASLYGVIGLFLTLLIIALMALRKNSWGLFLLGLMPAVHLTLSILCWLAVSLGLVWDRKSELSQLKPFLKFFALGFALFLLTFLWHRINNQLDPASLTLLPSTNELVEYFLKYWDDHNTLISLPLLPFFFEVDLYLIIMAASYLSAFPQSAFSPGHFIAKALLGTTLAATLYVVLQSIFPFLLPLNLNIILSRLLIYRWLNLNSMAMPAMLIGLLSWLVLQNRNLMALVILALIGLCALSNTILSLSIASALPYLLGYSLQTETLLFLHALGKSLLFPLAALGASYLTLKSTRSHFLNKTYPARWTELLNPLMAFAVLLPLLVISFSPFKFTKFAGADANSDLLTKAGQTEGLILSASLWEVDRIQLRTRHPVLMDLTQINLIGYVPGTAAIIEDILNTAYGLSLKDPRGYASYETISATWSGRTLTEWQTLQQRFGITRVIAPANYQLQLPLVGKSRDLIIYDIPAPGTKL